MENISLVNLKCRIELLISISHMNLQKRFVMIFTKFTEVSLELSSAVLTAPTQRLYRWNQENWKRAFESRMRIFRPE